MLDTFEKIIEFEVIQEWPYKNVAFGRCLQLCNIAQMKFSIFWWASK